MPALVTAQACGNEVGATFPDSGTRHGSGKSSGLDVELSEADRAHAAALMRVNHAGEVAAQALYAGQARMATDRRLRQHLERSAMEEARHLDWCRQRLSELGAAPSRLDPLWQVASHGVGLAVALLGDRVSLGFVAATEELVAEHLARHERLLPLADERSRAIVSTMRQEEIGHGDAAIARGGVHFPPPVKAGMALISRLMTTSSYRI